MTAQGGQTHDRSDLVQRALIAVREMRAQLEASENERREPIAIIGIGCRFPGGAVDGESFWRLLANGVDTVTDIPGDRWDTAAYYDPNPDAPGKMYVRTGAFLPGVDQFDAAFFGISPREAVCMDPQQRVLMEVAWEALEDAGLSQERLRGSRTGVFVGISTKDYVGVQDVRQAPEEIDAYFSTGHFFSVAAGRLSYILGLHGPSMAVDTACASSLVAVHLACQSLRAGESQIALAGGVNLLLGPEEFVASCKLRTLSPDGRCKTFDASANGYIRGEGCGVVVLKRLSRAVTDGDPIAALILGSATTHNGASGGLTVPNGHAWQMAISQALHNAAIEPDSVQYVEAHGTGTPLGDPIEIQAISTVLAQNRPEGSPLLVGSLKPNIGHLESAAGIAGLIKTVMALRHREIPPHIHLRQISPRIPLRELRVRVPTQRLPWPEVKGRRRAGVSSAGISGVDMHLVLEEAPEPLAAPQPATAGCHLLPISARSPEALRLLAAAYQRELERDRADQLLQDRCFTAGARRTHHDHRLAVVGQSSRALAAQLREFLRQQPASGWATGIAWPDRRADIVFVFPGHGGQWCGMARNLLAREPVFAQELQRCDEAFRPYLDWSLVDALATSDHASPLDHVDVVQPVLCGLQIALAALWRSWGIEPAAVIGHSMGEVAAAHIAGILSLSDAGKIICARSRLLRTLSGRGAMASIGLSASETAQRLVPYADHLSVAAVNGPDSTVVSGESHALRDFQRACERDDISFTFVKVDVPSHTAQVDQLRDQLLNDLSTVHPRPGQVPLYSTVTGALVAGGEMGAEYWVRNLRQRVLFGPTVEVMARDGYVTYIELSPHPLLTVQIARQLDQYESALVLPSMRRDQDDQRIMLGSLAALYAAGYTVEWAEVSGPGQCVRLPAYPWQRQRYWPTRHLPPPRPSTDHRHTSAPALHAQRVHSPLDQIQYETILDPEQLPYLRDHALARAPWAAAETVVSASAYIALVLAAAREEWGYTQITLENVEFLEMLLLGARTSTTVQLILSQRAGSGHEFAVFSAPTSAGRGQAAPWTLHARGTVRGHREPSPAGRLQTLSSPTATIDRVVSGDDLYAALQTAGYHYGPFYRWQDVLKRDADQTWVRFRPARAEDGVDQFVCHPGLLDAVIQLLCDSLYVSPEPPEQAPPALHVPVSIERVWFDRVDGTEFEAHAHLCPPTDGGSVGLEGDLQLCAGNGRVLLEMERVKLAPIDPALLGRNQVPPWLYTSTWRSAPLGPSRPVNSGPGRWLILDESPEFGSALARELEGRGFGTTRLAVATPDAWCAALRHRIEHVADQWNGVAYIAGSATPTTESVPDEALARGTRVLELMQTLIRCAPLAPSGRLWLLTPGVHGQNNLVDAPLWGLGRVMNLEHPDLWGGMLDFDSTASNDDLALVADEILSEPHAEQVCFRAGNRLVARLTPAGDIPVRPDPLNAGQADGGCLLAEASYLITGGLGNLGLLAAQRLVRLGARHLVLLGKHGLSSEAQAAINEMRHAGIHIVVAHADVAERDDLQHVFAMIDQELPPLRGVLHAAGVLDDGALLTLTPERVECVFAPKVRGAWNLHLLTMERSLDFFVLYSSAVALLGAPGQANYAAASAFLDALAHARRAADLPALSINWGPWAEVGLAMTPQIRQRGSYQHMDLIPVAAGLDVLEYLLPRDGIQVAVLPFRMKEIAAPGVAEQLPVLTELVDEAQIEGQPTDSTVEISPLLPRLHALPAAERTKAVADLVRSAIGRVLGLENKMTLASHRPLRELGFDSLMAVELRNVLRSLTGLSLAATLVYDYPTVDALTQFLVSRLLPEDELATVRPSAGQGSDAR